MQTVGRSLILAEIVLFRIEIKNWVPRVSPIFSLWVFLCCWCWCSQSQNQLLTTLTFNEHQEQFFRCADDEREKENKSSAAERTDYLAVSQTRESGCSKMSTRFGTSATPICRLVYFFETAKWQIFGKRPIKGRKNIQKMWAHHNLFYFILLPRASNDANARSMKRGTDFENAHAWTDFDCCGA